MFEVWGQGCYKRPCRGRFGWRLTKGCFVRNVVNGRGGNISSCWSVVDSEGMFVVVLLPPDVCGPTVFTHFQPSTVWVRKDGLRIKISFLMMSQFRGLQSNPSIYLLVIKCASPSIYTMRGN